MELYMRMHRLIESTPALLAVFPRRQAEREELIAREIARREGLDPDEELRPRILVAAVGGVVQAALRHWGQCEDLTVESMRRNLTGHLDLLGPALATSWRRPDAPQGE